MHTDSPLAAGRLDGRPYTVTGAHINMWGQPELAYVFDDAPRVHRFADKGSPVWTHAINIPRVAAAVEHAAAEAAAAEAARKAEAERARAERDRAEADARRENARLRAEAETTGRACYIRFGRLPKSRQSWNHRDGHTEPGVSVYPAWRLPGDRYVIDLAGLDVFSSLFVADGDQPVYRVTGTVAEATGADGEPLITGAKARRIHPSEIRTVI